VTLSGAFAEARPEGRALLLPYLMAGVPDADASVDLFVAMAEAGADGFEVGIPYADPLMDGPVIQEAGGRALAGGMTMTGGIEVAGRVAERTGKPCLVMTYINPILHRGMDRFCAHLADAGVEGIIVADLPMDEAGTLREAASAHGLGVVPLVAPTSPELRIREAAAAGPPFVYGVAELGVTGERSGLSARAAGLVERIRGVTDLPVGLGVGISTPDQARAAATIADAVIVGSALVRLVLEADTAREAALALRGVVAALREAMVASGT
jgi:tryptophan synthase alpha chain